MVMVMMTCSAFAASKTTDSDFAVLIIGGAEFKTPEYYKLIEKTVRKECNIDCVVGDQVQSKYQRYLFDNDIDNEKVRKSDFVKFSTNSGYRQMLFLVLDSTTDIQSNAKTRQKNRISVQLDAYVFSGRNLVNSATTNKDSISKTSALRARKDAFESSLKEVLRAMGMTAKK